MKMKRKLIVLLTTLVLSPMCESTPGTMLTLESQRKFDFNQVIDKIEIELEKQNMEQLSVVESIEETASTEKEIAVEETPSVDISISDEIEIPTTAVPEKPEEEIASVDEIQENEFQEIEVLTPQKGTVNGPSGKETYYNLDMSSVIAEMRSLGFNYEYWIREDGVKMLGTYVMCAANNNVYPKGSLIETSLGLGIVCDTGVFAYYNPNQVDIAVNW